MSGGLTRRAGENVILAAPRVAWMAWECCSWAFAVRRSKRHDLVYFAVPPRSPVLHVATRHGRVPPFARRPRRRAVSAPPRGGSIAVQATPGRARRSDARPARRRRRQGHGPAALPRRSDLPRALRSRLVPQLRGACLSRSLDRSRELRPLRFATHWLAILVVLASVGLRPTVLRFAAAHLARQEWPFLRGLLQVATRWTLGHRPRSCCCRSAPGRSRAHPSTRQVCRCCSSSWHCPFWR
jgi:hypothetical protein